MKRILQGVQAVDGVQGSFVVDGNGELLAYHAHAIYDAALMENVGQTVVTTVDSIRLLHEDWETLSASFAEGAVILRNVKPKGAASGRTVILGVIGDNRLNASFAGVAMRVATSKLKSMLEAPPSAADQSGSYGVPTESSAGIPSSRAVPVPMAGPASSSVAFSGSSVGRSTDVASSGVSWSGPLGSSPRSAAEPAMADTESAAFVASATKALGRTVGPMAKVLVKEALRKLCPDGSFSRAHWDALVAELTRHIQGSVQAAEFQSALRARS